MKSKESLLLRCNPYFEIDHISIFGGTGLELACSGGSCGGNLIKKRLMSFAFEMTPCISLSCKLVPGLPILRIRIWPITQDIRYILYPAVFYGSHLQK